MAATGTPQPWIAGEITTIERDVHGLAVSARPLSTRIPDGTAAQVPSQGCEESSSATKQILGGGADMPESEAHNAAHEWDRADSVIGRWARLCHDHYFIVVLAWAVLSVTLISVVMFGPVDQRCAPDTSQNQMTVCEQTDHDWEVTFGVNSLRKDALSDALLKGKDAFKNITGRKLGAVPERTIAIDENAVTFVYEYPAEDGKSEQSIFTPHTVQAMCEHEAAVTAHSLYPLVCVLDADGECAEITTSVVRFFYANGERDPASGGCALLREEEVQEAAARLMTNLATSINGFFVNEAAEEGGYTNATRSMIQFGGPLAGFQDESDDKSVQLLLYDRFFQGWNCPSKPQETGAYSGPDACEFVNGDAAASTTIASPEKTLLTRFGMAGTPDGGSYDGALRSPYFTKPVEKLPDGGMVSYFWAIRFQAKEFERVVNGDLNFAVLSVIVVYLYIWFHVRSSFIAAVSMLQIILCLPVGYFVYYNVFQYHYYSQLHILTVYLSLGIGADNVFVLVDAWRQSATHPDISTVVGRLHYTLERCVKACAITTFTTVMSFVATSLTPIMPIHAFAVYASVVLIFNYLFTISLSPAIVMIHHVFFSTRGGCCCCGCGAASYCKAMEEAEDEDLRAMRERDRCFFACGKHCEGGGAGVANRAENSEPGATAEGPGVEDSGGAGGEGGVEGRAGEGNDDMGIGGAAAAGKGAGSAKEEVVDGKGQEGAVPEQRWMKGGEATGRVGWEHVLAVGEEPRLRVEAQRLRWTESFFREKYAAVICGKVPGQRKPVAWGIVAAFAAYAAMMIWQGLQLAPPSSAEAWFPSNHMMSEDLYDRMSKGWYGGANSEFLSVVFVFGVETIDRSGYNRFFPGVHRGDVVFSSGFDATSEAAQLFFIDRCAEIRAAPCGVEGVCVYDSLIKPDTIDSFVCVVGAMRDYYRRHYPGADPAASHVPPAEFVHVWQSFLTDPAQFGSNASDAEALLAQHQSRYQQALGLVDGRVAFLALRVVSSFPFPTPNAQTHQFYDGLEARVEGWKAAAPPEMREIFQTDDRRPTWGFTWMAVEDALVRNLLLGFAICFPVAWAVLMLSTGNAVIAVYATLSIACIVAGVLGAVRLYFGWDLGIAESISGVIVIGFSVDYTVHLGHMYTAASHLRTREEKTIYALTYIGPTVIGGGLTTLLSASVLFLCTLKFFTKMATLLALTVSLSVLHAMLFFVSLCAVAGPTNEGAAGAGGMGIDDNRPLPVTVVST